MGSYLFELVDELVSWHGYVWRQSSRLESYILDFHRYCLVSMILSQNKRDGGDKIEKKNEQNYI